MADQRNDDKSSPAARPAVRPFSRPSTAARPLLRPSATPARSARPPLVPGAAGSAPEPQSEPASPPAATVAVPAVEVDPTPPAETVQHDAATATAATEPAAPIWETLLARVTSAAEVDVSDLAPDDGPSEEAAFSLLSADAAALDESEDLDEATPTAADDALEPAEMYSPSAAEVVEPPSTEVEGEPAYGAAFGFPVEEQGPELLERTPTGAPLRVPTPAWLGSLDEPQHAASAPPEAAGTAPQIEDANGVWEGSVTRADPEAEAISSEIADAQELAAFELVEDTPVPASETHHEEAAPALGAPTPSGSTPEWEELLSRSHPEARWWAAEVPPSVHAEARAAGGAPSEGAGAGGGWDAPMMRALFATPHVAITAVQAAPAARSMAPPAEHQQAVAAVLARLAGRVQAGEIEVDSVVPDAGDAALLAGVLAALLRAPRSP